MVCSNESTKPVPIVRELPSRAFYRSIREAARAHGVGVATIFRAIEDRHVLRIGASFRRATVRDVEAKK
jgi:hypothetical protein